MRKRGAASPPSQADGTALEHPDDPLAGLDPDQRRAAEQLDGPLLIVAGPGTGKTRTLVARAAHQVRSGHVAADQVLAIAFTNQAADELRARLAVALPRGAGAGPRVTTFHGFGLALLTELGPTTPRIVDDDDRLELVTRAAGGTAVRREVEALLGRISLAKQAPDPRAVLRGDAAVLSAFERYEGLLADNGVIDVDDLVLHPYRRLADDPALAAEVAGRYRSVAVDEYQDVNDVQAALVALLAPGGRALLAIGDPDQAIYGFRGARPGHFARFAETFPATTVIALATTYRLGAHVLAAAGAVLPRAPRLAALQDGPPVELVSCPTTASEAEQILVRLERLVGGSSHYAVDTGRAEQGAAPAGGAVVEEETLGFGDIAVLTRTRAQRREIAAALDRSGIPCRAVGEDEPHDPRSQKVALMTMHAAKGREFEVVFVAGVEPGLVPLELEGRAVDVDEERRLLYVACTRARRLLVLSHAARRTLWGQRLPGGPSPLLAGLPAAAVIRSTAALPPRRPDASQLDLF